jgi:hypothetical protein
MPTALSVLTNNNLGLSPLYGLLYNAVSITGLQWNDEVINGAEFERFERWYSWPYASSVPAFG